MNYHPEMLRLPLLVTAAVALALGGAPVVSAEPSPAGCQFTLSPPQIVQLSGANVVTSTLSLAACDHAVGYQTVACIQLQGSPGPGQCAAQNGILTAQVFYQPYRPGATYVATGRGCATTGNPPQPVCTPMGPLTATL